MKKLNFFLIGILFSGFTFAQTYINSLDGSKIDDNKAGRNCLFELFSTEKCPNCPPVDDYIYNYVKDKKNVILVVHHAGFYTDKFTIPESSGQYIKLYNSGTGTYAPAGCIDRVWNNLDNDADGQIEPGPIFWPGSPYGVNVLTQRLARPADVNVSISGNYDVATHALNVTVSGAFLATLTGVYGVSLFITEDSLPSTTQAGHSGTYIHHFAIRDVISKVWGDTLDSTTIGSTFSKTFTFNVNSAWNVNKLYLAGFVNKINTDMKKKDVMNAKQIRLTDLIGTSVKPENIDAKLVNVFPNPNNGTFNIDLNILYKKADIKIYNMLGECVLNDKVTSGLTPIDLTNFKNGIYMLQVNLNGEKKSFRIIKQ